MPPTPTPTPIPRGAESAPSRPYLTRDPPDIENLASDKLFLDFVFIRISQITTPFSAGAQPPHEGVRERRAVDGDEEEQEALEEERRQGEEPQQLRVR